MVAFDDGNATGTPGTSQIEIVGAFTANVTFANMFLSSQDQFRPLQHVGRKTPT